MSELPPKQTEKRIRLKKWTAVAFWSYDVTNDACSICHSQIMLPCITCAAEPQRAEKCTASWGQCGHAFHFHCISRWLVKQSTCPLDESAWEFVRY